MIKRVDGITAATALHHLRAAQRILDQLPYEIAAAARLAGLIDQLEESEADRMLKGAEARDTDIRS